MSLGLEHEETKVEFESSNPHLKFNNTTLLAVQFKKGSGGP